MYKIFFFIVVLIVGLFGDFIAGCFLGVLGLVYYLFFLFKISNSPTIVINPKEGTEKLN
jgi:hypothetical protein